MGWPAPMVATTATAKAKRGTEAKAAKPATRWDNRETAIALLQGWTPPAATSTATGHHAMEAKAARGAVRFASDFALTGF